MNPRRGRFRVNLEGRGQITLGNSNYIATGGEGSIYKAGDTTVKILTDPDRMRKQGMADKLKLLRGLQHDYIVAPQGIVNNEKGAPIGFYMPFVEGENMPRIFTSAFWQRDGFDVGDAKVLTARMHEAMNFAHANGAIMVDPNEFNWIVDLSNKSSGPTPHVIDVDSWAIGRWPATAIMPSVRDYHSSDFNTLTDWFSWGIVTFQVFIGMHPYKGSLSGFKRGDLEARMRANASVFRKGAGLPRAAREFKDIPGPLLDWYLSVFENGERTIPPSPTQTGVAYAKVAVTRHVTVTKTGALIFEKIFEDTGAKVLRIWPSGVVLLDSNILYDLKSKRVITSVKSRSCEVIKTGTGWLIVDDARPLELFHVTSSGLSRIDFPMSIRGRGIFRYENRVFVVTERGLTELRVTEFGKPMLSVSNTWGVMVNATSFFDGVGIQDAMGSKFLVTPFGEGSFTQIRTPELDYLKVVDAKAGNRFVSVVVADSNGDYHKLEFTISEDYTSYQVWKGATDSPDLNLAILPRGVCATIIKDGELDIFVPRSGALNRVQDSYVSTDMQLANLDDTVVYNHRGAIWSVRMRT